VAGATGIPPDFWVLKLSPSGEVEWQKAYGGDQAERRSESIEMTTDGGYITGGTSQSFGTGNDVLVLKLKQDGSIDPSCDLVRDTAAPAVDSSVEADDTSVTGVDSDITPEDSTAEPQDTAMSADDVCRAAEDCRNGVDDDLDRLVDCGDPDCAMSAACAAPVPAVTPSGWIAILAVITLCGFWGLRRRFV